MTVLFLPIPLVTAQYQWLDQNIVFKKLPHGISQNSVNTITQDQEGFIWIGTDDGLNRFDGYKFDVFRHQSDNDQSISNSLIRALCTDSDGNLWVGAERGGLNLYNPQTDGFEIFDHVMGDGHLLSRSSIYDIMIDSDGLMWIATNHGIVHFSPRLKSFVSTMEVNAGLTLYDIGILDLMEDEGGVIWIGSDGHGLWKYDKMGERLDHYQTSEEGSLSSNYVRALHEDELGNIWIGTSDGLNLYDPGNDNFILYKSLNQAGASVSDDIWALSQDAKSRLTVGTDGGGLSIMVDGKFESFLPDDHEENSIEDNVIRDLYRDNTGNLWIGTFRKGVNLISHRQENFYFLEKGLNGLKNNSILDISASADDYLWVGTDGGGLHQFNRATGMFTQVRLSGYEESDQVVLSVLEDENRGLWMGTYEGGLVHHTPTGHIRRFNAGSSTLANNSVLALFQDSNGTIWIGTNGGINYFDHSSQSIKSLAGATTNSLLDNQNSIRAIAEDERKNLWLGMMGGVKKIDLSTNDITTYYFEGESKNYLTQAILNEGAGSFWLGTLGGGLIQFDPEKGIVENYSVEDGLPSNAVYGLQEDSHGKLWISTGKGIAKYDPSTAAFENYVDKDGYGNQYNRGAHYEDELGYLWFGSTEGLNVFHPDSIQFNDEASNVAFTDLKIFNKSVDAGQDGILENAINLVDRVVLDHTHSVFTLEFAGLNYANPGVSKYQIYLEGFDPGWRDIGEQRSATYTNLDPGEYIFHVRVADSSNGSLTNKRDLQIIITPPWWKTWWAYTIYLVIIAAVLVFARQVIVYRERLKTNLKLEHMELTHLQEIDHMKSKFFANISHELRTPLTLILDPLKMMYDREAHPKVQKQLKTMIRNAQRLLRLINQLLDLSKIEEGSMALQKKRLDVVHWLRQVLPAFASFAEQHNIKFSSKLPASGLMMDFDQDKMEKVISNLLSNALKFTPDGGEINVYVGPIDEKDVPDNLNQKKCWLLLEVNDTGAGIPRKRIKYVFDRFYQVDGAHHREQEGTGIGLSLTKELVDLHGGEIVIQSKEGKGTTVSVYLPYSSDCENDASSEVKKTKTDLYNQLESTVHSGGYGLSSVKAGHGAPLILIVEDNADVSGYIADQLGDQYRIKEAKNGKEGLDIAINSLPDLIVSDIMMPLMDGIELTKSLKSDQRTSHIPIILLTAKAEEDDVFEGIDTGADDYVVKPFDSKLLEARIKNIIKSRELLREKFADNKVINLEPKEVAATPIDEMFLRKAIESVENNMSNSEFTVEDFGNEVGLSRMQLYRKLKALTDQSPNEFIRTIRLKRAAQLIHLNELTISQITYEVGFNDLQYFRDCFKKTFWCKPVGLHLICPQRGVRQYRIRLKLIQTFVCLKNGGLSHFQAA